MIEPYIGQTLTINGEEWTIVGHPVWSEQYVEFEREGRPVKLIRPMTVVQPHLANLTPNPDSATVEP